MKALDTVVLILKLCTVCEDCILKHYCETREFCRLLCVFRGPQSCTCSNAHRKVQLLASCQQSVKMCIQVSTTVCHVTDNLVSSALI